ncbi:MAG: hypothetical protein R3A52_22475 [Polyangiales bacterium]
MSDPPRAPWLSSAPPWQVEVSADLLRDLGALVDAVPVVEVPGAPLALAEMVALRANRYVPLFGWGPTRDEARRAAALVTWAFRADGDARALEHALVMTTHPAMGTAALQHLGEAVAAGVAPTYMADLALGAVALLGGGDGLRRSVATAMSGAPSRAELVQRVRAVGGGDVGSWREHYQSLCEAASGAPAGGALAVSRAWFEWVLARRWSGLDALSSADTQGLDAAARWLVASARWVAGEPGAREEMTAVVESGISEVQATLPRLTAVLARDLAEVFAHPWALRWSHLQCAAARDHASVAIRTWLHAASEEEVEVAETGSRALGPEPSRAGRAAVEARQRAGDFLLDWFVPTREARARVDAWAAKALRVHHRLLGASLVASALREVTP